MQTAGPDREGCGVHVGEFAGAGPGVLALRHHRSRPAVPLTDPYEVQDPKMDTSELFDQIAEDLAAAGAVAGAMFGKRALLAEGKAFACLKDDALAFRLGAKTPAHAAALGVPGAHLFDPSGKERPFKDWVAIPAAQHRHWRSYAVTALATLRP